MSEDYSLKKSMDSLGVLVPVIKNKRTGHLIDGKHRSELKPDAPVYEVDIPEELEPLARLAINNVRRNADADMVEWQQILSNLKNKKPQDVADLTGLNVRTVYRHWPQELKDEKISKATSEAKSEIVRQGLTPVTPLSKTQETPQAIRVPPPLISDYLECSNCHMSVHITKAKTLNGKDVCLGCYAQLVNLPKVPPKAEPSKKPVESWEQRKAQMSPQHSKMEMNLYKRLKEAGYDVELDHFFCTEGSVPDFFFVKENTIAYVDGEDVHKDEEDDEALRDKVVVRHKLRLLPPLRYKIWSQAVEDEFFKRIVNELSLGEGNK